MRRMARAGRDNRALEATRRQADSRRRGRALGDRGPGPGARSPSATRSSTSRPRRRGGAWSTSPASPTRRRSSAGCRRKATGSAPPTPRCRSRSSTTCSARAAATTSCGTIPGLVDDYARPGERQAALPPLLGQRKAPRSSASSAPRPPPQQGYGWQYTYLFFRNQDEAKRFGIDEDFLDSLAGSIDELDVPEWRSYLEQQRRLRRRNRQAARGLRRARHRPRHPHPPGGDRQRPGGTRTLQDGPTLAQIEQAIQAVR